MAICTLEKDKITGRSKCFEDTKIQIGNLGKKERLNLCLDSVEKIAAYMINGGKDGELILQWSIIPFKIASNAHELSSEQEKLFVKTMKHLFKSIFGIEMDDKNILALTKSLPSEIVINKFDALMENLSVFVENFSSGFADVYLKYTLCIASYCSEEWDEEYQTKLDNALAAGYESTLRIGVALD